jgi:hypothetical protein
MTVFSVVFVLPMPGAPNAVSLLLGFVVSFR